MRRNFSSETIWPPWNIYSLFSALVRPRQSRGVTVFCFPALVAIKHEITMKLFGSLLFTAAALASAAATPEGQCDDATCQGTAAERCGKVKAASWNVAAINNNPFEYWITYESDSYHEIMEAIQNIIIEPGDYDVPISDVFTDDMFADLKKQMLAREWTHVDSVEQEWSTFKSRTIVNGFLKDKLLGKKRLASMPDRTTNTVNTDTGPVYRPSVINCYGDALPNTEAWWRKWQDFIFHSSVTLRGEEVDVADLLVPIKRSKYPLVTEEEEKMSIPLQTMCAAIFDAILVHLLNTVVRYKGSVLQLIHKR